MAVRLHRGGAETAERDAERQPSLRLSQRSPSLRGEFPSKTGKSFFYASDVSSVEFHFVAFVGP